MKARSNANDVLDRRRRRVGTGNPIVEQLMRLGVGVLMIVDDDRMEKRNVNRILNSTMRDVRDKRLKVDVLGDAVERAELGTEVIRLPKGSLEPRRNPRHCTMRYRVRVHGHG